MSALMNSLSEVSFHDGRTFHIGDRVHVWTKYGTDCDATVIGFGRAQHTITIKVQPDAWTEYGDFDRWPLSKGGEYNRLVQVGVSGGEIK